MHTSLFIPGGETADLVHHTGLLDLIRTLHAAGKGIGAICGGVSVLRAAGILENKAYVDNESSPESPNVVADGNIITAKANGYVDFALEIGRLMNIYKDQADLQETIDFFKYFKPV
ncbi:DJ-1/PfpI family protein [Paenibacillus albidus]|nr:DJ-1/PfpI family protein [Paenibacillus albidus]